MSRNAEAFDHWIRTSFVEMNTALENLYFSSDNRAQVVGVGDSIKNQLRDEGHVHVVARGEPARPHRQRPAVAGADSLAVSASGHAARGRSPRHRNPAPRPGAAAGAPETCYSCRTTAVIRLRISSAPERVRRLP